ncbi:MAG: 30S ribosomal protein S8 [Clostridia bacterium]|nr:30S ribosomal protein S8 [Clostridia bacterium]
MTDPIADMLTRIRNALVTKKPNVVVPVSRTKKAIAKILQDEGYIKSVEINRGDVVDNMLITLKYDAGHTRVITGLRRISKPGLRVYAGRDELPRVLNGLGIAIVSTSHGIMTDRQARSEGVGGEVMAYVW